MQVDGSIVSFTSVIGSGGTLRGVGSVGHINLGPGIIAPGDTTGPGTLHGSSLTWTGGSTLNFRLGATNTNADSDLLVLSDFLNLIDNTHGFKFHFSDGNGPPAIGTTYTLITFVRNINVAASVFSFDYSGADGGFVGAFTLTANALQFTPTAFPVRLQSFTVD